MREKLRNRNYIPWNRNWYTVKRHLPIILKPTILALVAVLAWKFLLLNTDTNLGHQTENPLIFVVLPMVAFVYVIFAGIAVESVFQEYKTISRCVVKKDVETFLLHRDEQLPIVMHLLVGAPSVLLVLLVMLLEYSNVAIGYATVFSVVFVVVLTWVISTELDSYEKSIWFKEKIPKDWFEIDIDEFFTQSKR